MTQLEKAIVDWADGLWPDRDAGSILDKMVDEFTELIKAVGRKKQPSEIRGEIGDVGILLADLASLFPDDHGGIATLEGCMREKFKRVEKRSYDEHGNR